MIHGRIENGYTESEKKKMDQIREVFKKHIQQSPVSELLWSDKLDMCGWRLA